MFPPTDEVQPGDVFQIRPDFDNRAFACCMVTVSEVKSFGFQGYVTCLGNDRETTGGLAYIRLAWKDVEPVGRAAWISEPSS